MEGVCEDDNVHSQEENETQIDNEVDELAYALANFNGIGHNQLSFSVGDKISILDKSNEDWWWAEINGCHGYVPVNHLTYTNAQEVFWQDQEYFGNYGNLKIHHEMLSDQPRNLCYKETIERNAPYIRNKVVLDVGCGSGILSLLCAKYGNPRKVYAVEASDMAAMTRGVVKHNGFQDIIEVRHCYIEDLELEENVDIIISEWMGTLLLFEMMLESVLIARDRFLKEEGVMWPSQASLIMAPCSANDKYSSLISFWDNQYGFDFSSLTDAAKKEFFEKPYHNYKLERSQCLASEVELFSLDLHRLKATDLEEIASKFKFSILKDGLMHGFCTWFQTDFESFGSGVKKTFLNTGPDFEQTHWAQNLFMLDDPIDVQAEDSVCGTTTITRHPQWRRHLRFKITFDHIAKETKKVNSYEKEFLVWR